MRRPRIKADGAGYYHCLFRFIERRHVFGPKEKERFLALMGNQAAFSGLDIMTYALHTFRRHRPHLTSTSMLSPRYVIAGDEHVGLASAALRPRLGALPHYLSGPLCRGAGAAC